MKTFMYGVRHPMYGVRHPKIMRHDHEEKIGDILWMSEKNGVNICGCLPPKYCDTKMLDRGAGPNSFS